MNKMGLKVDKTHKKIDLKSLAKDKIKKISIGLTSLVMTLSIFSGCSKRVKDVFSDDVVDTTSSISDVIDGSFDNNYDSIEVDNVSYDLIDDNSSRSVSNNDNSEFELKNAYTIVNLDGTTSSVFKKMTKEELSKISSISVVLEDGVDYSYLNYLTNVESIKFIDRLKNDKLDYIDGSIFKSGVDISFNSATADDIPIFNEEKFPFLKDVSSFGTLTIGASNSYNTDGSFISNLNHINNLVLTIDENTNIKSIDFSNIDSLEIIGEPYNVAMYLTSKDINDLENKGVSISYRNMDEFNEISSELDNIYSSLSIYDNETDKQKLDKILSYVLNKYTYDQKIQNYLDNGVEHSEETYKFYENGYLYGSLNKDTEICGNYAAMVTALCNRANIDSYFLSSKNHAWNAVLLGDYYYYVDSTWMDGQDVIIPSNSDNVDFDNGMSIQTHDYSSKKAEEIFRTNDDYEKAYVDWYLENPFNLPTSGNKNVSHDLRFMPDGLNLVDIPEKIRIEQLGIDIERVYEGSDVSENQYKVTINKSDNTNEVHFVPSSIVVGILSGLGIGFLKRRKNKKEEKNNNKTL